MEDLQLFAKIEPEIESLVETTDEQQEYKHELQYFKEFGGPFKTGDGRRFLREVELPTKNRMEVLGAHGYKYLDIH